MKTKEIIDYILHIQDEAHKGKGINKIMSNYSKSYGIKLKERDNGKEETKN